MSQTPREVEGKGQMASNDRMEVPQRDLDAEEGEPRADARSGQKWCLTVTLRTTAIALLVLVIVLSTTQRSAEIQTSKPFVNDHLEQLQRCQRDQQEVKLMVQSVTQDSRCRLCPDGWLWWKNQCFFFSVGMQENRQWNESAVFCQQHNSSLVVIKDSVEMDFIQKEMNKFSSFPFLWVGLTDSQQEGRWLWWDGTDLQHHLSLTVQWDTEDRDCADLRGDGSLFAAECTTYGPWACKRET